MSLEENYARPSGHFSYLVEARITNTSHTRCSISGYPQLEITYANGASATATRLSAPGRRDNITYLRQTVGQQGHPSAPDQPIALTPGKYATVFVQTKPDDRCDTSGGEHSSWHLVLPDSMGAIDISNVWTYACSRSPIEVTSFMLPGSAPGAAATFITPTQNHSPK